MVLCLMEYLPEFSCMAEVLQLSGNNTSLVIVQLNYIFLYIIMQIKLIQCNLLRAEKHKNSKKLIECRRLVFSHHFFQSSLKSLHVIIHCLIHFISPTSHFYTPNFYSNIPTLPHCPSISSSGTVILFVSSQFVARPHQARVLIKHFRTTDAASNEWQGRKALLSTHHHRLNE